MTNHEILWNLSPSQKRVLQTIWRQAPIARNDLSRKTGLAPATVTRLVRDMEERGLVYDTVLHGGERGQPQRPVCLRPGGAYAFGVYFSHTFMETGLIDLSGELIAKERIFFDRASAERIADGAAESLTRLSAMSGISYSQIVGAGFALPGDFVENPAFLHAHAYFPDLAQQDLLQIFADRMPIKVFVENDAASAALGECLHGVGRQMRSVVYIHIGHGVGGGLVLNGQLYRGVRGNAGVLGVVYPMSEPRPSGQDLLESLEGAGVKVRDFHDLEALDPADCPPLRRWVVRAGAQLENGIQIAARLLDPDAVILGGRLPPHILDALYRSIDVDSAFRISRAIPVPKVVRSQLGPGAGVVGAASICLFETFFQPGSDIHMALEGG